MEILSNISDGNGIFIDKEGTIRLIKQEFQITNVKV